MKNQKNKSKNKEPKEEYEVSQSTQGNIVIGFFIIVFVVLIVAVLTGNYNKGF